MENNNILIILSSLLLLLYSKWIACLLLYPLMAMNALGERIKYDKVACGLRFPLRVVEHFLRSGGGQDLCCSR